MSKIYLLNNNKEEYKTFIEADNTPKFTDLNESWDVPNLADYKFELGGYDKKNYKFDVSKHLNLVIFSEHAINFLQDILEESGTIFPVNTTSKRKKFYGFFPHKKIYNENVVDFKKSDFAEYTDHFSFRRILFNHSAPLNEYIFVLENKLSDFDIFVTDKFKKLVEDNNLVGFDFSDVVYDSERDPYKEFHLIQNNLDKVPLLREVFNYNGRKEDFASIIPDKEIAHEYPFIWIEKKFLNLTRDEYEQLCLNNKEVDDFAFKLLKYHHWCSDNGIRTKDKYLIHMPPQTFEKRNYNQTDFDNMLKKYDLYPRGY